MERRTVFCAGCAGFWLLAGLAGFEGLLAGGFGAGLVAWGLLALFPASPPDASTTTSAMAAMVSKARRRGRRLRLRSACDGSAGSWPTTFSFGRLAAAAVAVPVHAPEGSFASRARSSAISG